MFLDENIFYLRVFVELLVGKKRDFMKKIIVRITIIELMLVFMASCIGFNKTAVKVAPGAPGAPSVWSYAGKTAIGTSYETYTNSVYSDQGKSGVISKVWFSVADGILTETMFGLIHEAQIKEMQLVIVGPGFIDFENKDTENSIEYLDTDVNGRPISLAYKIITRDKEGLYEIEKHVFTNPDDQALFVRVSYSSTIEGITPYLYLNPHIGNTGSGDQARVDHKSMHAFEDNHHLTLLSSRRFNEVTTGFVGVSDGLTDLMENGKLLNAYNSTGNGVGNVAMMAQLKTMNNQPITYDFCIGFGKSAKDSRNSASATLKHGYSKVLAAYNGNGDAIGWEDYIASLPELGRLYGTTTDDGKLLNVSAMVLKAQEDKSNAGALIASLSNPWGETTSADQPATGYKAVWPRDFYQCAMALLALGDTQTPLVAFNYLEKVQVNQHTSGNTGVGGWFLQKTRVDGELEWESVQLDQTAMPIMLGWKLWKAGILNKDSAIVKYQHMLKPAADFLVSGGKITLNSNNYEIIPPATQQERWEEQYGYSPSTIAAVVTGLRAAAEFAGLNGDTDDAIGYQETANAYDQAIESSTFTTSGFFKEYEANGKYFIRITRNNNPDDHATIGKNNGKEGLDETKILDAGFLELVRYGVRKASAGSIVESIPELDNQFIDENLKVKYNFNFNNNEKVYPGWRRYGNDGYGESTFDGSHYGKMDSTQRGRVWPIFTGERGHYELALGLENGNPDVDKIKNTYVAAMEHFANKGLMLPEQVWDGVGINPGKYEIGEGTNSATPLAWSHAEYIKLVRSLADLQVWDRYPLNEQMQDTD